MIEAGLVAGYMVAWAVQAKRVAGRLDAEVDTVLRVGLDHLHQVVTTKLGADPALADMQDEAARDRQVSDRTRERLELSLQASAPRTLRSPGR